MRLSARRRSLMGSNKQRDEIEALSRPNAALIDETIRADGESELDRNSVALVLSGLAAGLSMGFSHAWLPQGPAQGPISHLGYTVGFLIVVLGRQQLFTENTLTPILPLLNNRDASTLFGLKFSLPMSWEPGCLQLSQLIARFSRMRSSKRFLRSASKPRLLLLAQHFLRAVFAGWLIALMVWLLPGAEFAPRDYHRYHIRRVRCGVRSRHSSVCRLLVPCRGGSGDLAKFCEFIFYSYADRQYRRRRLACSRAELWPGRTRN